MTSVWNICAENTEQQTRKQTEKCCAFWNIGQKEQTGKRKKAIHIFLYLTCVQIYRTYIKDKASIMCEQCLCVSLFTGLENPQIDF